MKKTAITYTIILSIILSASTIAAQDPQTVTISGQILAECDGMQAPLPDVTVQLSDLVNWDFYTTQTGPDGSYSFTFEAVPPPYGPLAYVEATLPADHRAVSPSGWSIEVYPGQTTIDFVAACIVPGVFGRVMDACVYPAQPAAGVTMHLEDIAGVYPSLSTVTAADGTYGFETDPDWIGGRVSVVPPEHLTYRFPSNGYYNVDLTLGLVRNFTLECRPDTTYIYCEDFESDDHGWEPVDLTYLNGRGELAPDDPDSTHWELNAVDLGDGQGLRGVWWCGAEDTCLLPFAPGYGPLWDQRLSKQFVLPDGTVALALEHQYDTEPTYDNCHVEISTDDGVTFVTLASFNGASGGFVIDEIDLSAFAGDTALLRFRFQSDGGWDDSDGMFDGNGAWRIDQVQVTGYAADLFETGADGWVPEPSPTSTAAFRLDTADPVDDAGRFWTAADPETGIVPQNSPERQNLIGIESPWIDVPLDADQLRFHYCARIEQFEYYDHHYLKYFIGCENDQGCIEWNTNNYVFYGPWAGVWQRIGGTGTDIGGGLIYGATRFKVRILYWDLNGFQNPLTGTVTALDEHLTWAPYLDGVIVTALNTDAPGVEFPPTMSCPCDCPTGEPPLISISGTVVADCLTTLAGFPVDLLLPGGESLSTVTDENGHYSFDELAASDGEGEVTLIEPLSTTILSPEDGHQAVSLAADQTDVDFVLECADPVRLCRTIGYWKHQATVHLAGRTKGWQETLEDMSTNFPLLIFDHFHENDLNGIAVPGVTYIGDPDAPQPIDLETMLETFTVNRGGTMLDRAKQQYLALLLNLASFKLTPSFVVSDGDHTASQAIQECAHLILDGDESNDERAKTIADEINNRRMVDGALIEGDWVDIAYRPGRTPTGPAFMLAQNQPNPFNPMTTILFAVPAPGRVVITVHDVVGRRVATLAAASFEAGQHRLVWAGTDDQGARLPSGIYFAHMKADGFSASRKMSLLK